MAQLQPAIEKLFKLEGGYAAQDMSAGQVNYGLTERFLRQAGYLEEARNLKTLTRHRAVEIYRQEWWLKYHCGEILNQALAETYFVSIVNQGPRHPTRALQRGINAQFAVTVRPRIKEDGVIGPKTVKAIGFCHPFWLRDQLRLGAALRYMRIADTGEVRSDDYASVLSEWAGRLEAS